MSGGRRSHSRFNFTPSSEGVLRVSRDVMVRLTAPGEAVAIARYAGVVGDLVALHFAEENSGAGFHAHIVESRPIMVDGNLRHRLVLREQA